MAAQSSDLLQKVGLPGSATTLAGSGFTVGATTITVASTANHPEDTGYTFAIDVVEADEDGNEVRVPGTYCEFVGTVTSATTIGNITKTFGDDQDYDPGATTRVYIPVSSTRENRLVEWGLEHANQDGSLKTEAVRTALNLDTTSGAGWEPLAYTFSVSSGYNNGNRSFTLSTSDDLSAVVSKGMRFRIDRTIAAPTQCADLELSSSQYFNRANASVSGLSFTTAFTIEAWVKLESYGNGTDELAIVSRFTSPAAGFLLRVNPNGTVNILGASGGSVDGQTTYQSIPLNKWVHIAAQTDLVANTGAIYIDGVSVSTLGDHNSINAITNTGDLQIGAMTGADFFDGEIADVRLWNAIRTETEIRDNMFQQLTGTETNLIGYWKLNGDANDSTSNANHLTASGGAGFATDSAMNDTEYGIITDITPTTMTVFCPEGHGIPKETMTAPYYSTQKVPFGFPSERDRWQIASVVRSSSSQSSTSGSTYYNLGSPQITIPTGSWGVGFSAHLYAAAAASTSLSLVMALSESTATNSDTGLTQEFYQTAVTQETVQFSRHKDITVSSPLTYYLIGKANVNLNTMTFVAAGVDQILYAECAYL